MSPRRSAAQAHQTRQAIVERAVALASRVGLEGVTIGQLADGLGMSKAGVLGHFGSKQALQLAALRQAMQAFAARVWMPASGCQPGLTRLAAVCDAWLAYLADDALPGGCFLTAASCEFDGRPGAVHDAIAAALTRWLERLASDAAAAVAAGELPDCDPAQVAFELNALAQGANQGYQLLHDARVFERARTAMRRTLHLADSCSARPGPHPVPRWRTGH